MRPTAVAGSFYPSDPARLRRQVADYLKDAEPPALRGHVAALMVPHAGYVYSGPVAAHAYRVLQGQAVSTVLLLGNNHRAHFSGAALSPDAAWGSPLGPVSVDRQTAGELLGGSDVFMESRSAHAEEHSLEVQVPFVQTVLPDAKIVPILLADVGDEELTSIADGLATILTRPGVVLVASSDMSHYPAYAAARRSDLAMLEAIASLDPTRIRQRDRELLGEHTPDLHCTLCGMDAVITAILAGKQTGVTEAKTLRYQNSGDTAGDQGRCVGYGAVAFLAPEAAEELALTPTEKRRLLRVARQTLEARFGPAGKPSLDPGDSRLLAQPTACFVTLKQQGRLRGCIGELEARQPLIEAVADRAICAAEQDPRFPPVAADELDRIAIEISAMSPLRRVSGPDEIVVGKHGVVVKQGLRSGVFLPQVAPEQGWDRDTMLTILCTEKADLPADAWRQGAELWVFTANVFGEEEFGLAPPASRRD
ncbi:MAG: AmmeMemoRadiSam system protein B [Armatimonadetes bacterium]|nr:AmmeMemoRadiSam system protein B [Armatimonadota bacterium]